MLLRNNKSLANITKRSEAIFDVFTKTQKDCEALNAEISTVVTSKEEEIRSLQEEVSSLNAVKTKNTNLANKVNTFLTS